MKLIRHTSVGTLPEHRPRRAWHRECIESRGNQFSDLKTATLVMAGRISLGFNPTYVLIMINDGYGNEHFIRWMVSMVATVKVCCWSDDVLHRQGWYWHWYGKMSDVQGWVVVEHGPFKIEALAWKDAMYTNMITDPIILDIWKSNNHG